jgi:predicted metal-dependent hydrolase
LAAEQEALAKEMESMNQQHQEMQQMMGRMGELSKEMQDVADALKERQVDERIMKRQEKILTRLLDAQRSVREREYKKERVSRTAQGTLFNPAPGEADQNLGPDVIQQRLLEALKEGYTRDYQQLIREYFEALGREKK